MSVYKIAHVCTLRSPEKGEWSKQQQNNPQLEKNYRHYS